MATTSTTSTTSINTTSMLNTPQAVDDFYTLTEEQLDTAGGAYNVVKNVIDGSVTMTFDVMSNDLGGNAKTLWAVTDYNDAGQTAYTTSQIDDLISRDANGVFECTRAGASVAIVDGKLAYRLNATAMAAINALGAGESVTDTITYSIRLANGTLSLAEAKITIQGTNDAASISGTLTGAVVEDTTTTASGQAIVTDVDNGQAHTKVASGSTAYGSYTVDANGNWNYTLDHDKADALAAGEHAEDTFTITSLDGTATKTVTISITGTNDGASISGDNAGAVTEGDTTIVTGKLTVSDVDHNEAHTKAASLDSDYGAFSVDTDGNWSYELDQDAADSLRGGEIKTETFTVESKDGTDSETVTITITGVNDDASISGDTAGSVTEGDTTLATGKLNVSDVDTGEAHTKADNVDSAYGAFSVDTDGNWSYELDQGAADSLRGGEIKTETFTVESKDGTASETVTITITGVNDEASISGDTAGSVTEGDTTKATGTLTVSDVDTGEAHTKAATLDSDYGAFSVDTDGNWSYELDQDAADSLRGGETKTETFTVESKDGTDSETVTITITGVNDDATITGDTAGSVTEGDTTLATGKLTVSDVDTDEAHTQAGTTDSVYGSFTVDADGNWSYELDQAAANTLQANETKTETFTVKSADGTASQDVTITITGTNDAPTLGGTSTGAVTEDAANNKATGALTISDDDHDQSSFVAQSNTAGTYGSFSIGTDGSWTYTLDNSKTATNALNVNDHPTETFDVVTADGTHTSVVVTVNGANDAATISGATSGSVVEATASNVGTPNASGDLTASDPDNAVGFQAASGNASYGSFSIDANGHWSYALNNSNPTVDALGDNQTLSDSFTVKSEDGTSQTISITINGKTDVAPDTQGPTAISFLLDTSSNSPTTGGGVNTNSFLGTFTATDPTDTTFTYSLKMTDNSALPGGLGLTSTVPSGTITTAASISGAKAYLAVSTPGVGGGIYALTLTAKDAAGNSFDKAFNLIVLSSQSDTATGNSSTDIVYGFNGNDILNGVSGDDAIVGGAGNDTLNGGAGVNQLYGGEGADHFVFDSKSGNNLVLDFWATAGTGNNNKFGADVLDLLGTVFTGLSTTAGHLNATSFVASAGHTTINTAVAQVLYDTTSHDLYYHSAGSSSLTLIGNVVEANGALTANSIFVI